MSENRAESNNRSAEQRAEDLMQRLVSDGSRVVGKIFGRVREEVEDIVAEARARTRRPAA
jgi:ATP-dependent helicase YprA (DUF1998 family)